MTYFQLGRLEEALPFLEEALRLTERIHVASHRDHPDIVEGMRCVAAIYRGLKRHDDSLRLNQKLLALLSADHPDKAMTMHYLALDYGELRTNEGFDKAVRLLEEALALHQRVGAANPLFIAETLHDLGVTLHNRTNQLPTTGGGRLGGWEEAVGRFEQALEIRRDSLPASHPDILETIRMLDQSRLYFRATRARTCTPKVGRQKHKPNAVCPCGSGIKYKKCCMNKM